MSTMRITDIANPETNPLPEEAQLLVAYLLEGRVKSLAVVAEIAEPDGSTAWIEDYWIDLEGHTTNRRAFVGSMHMMSHDMTDEINFDEYAFAEGDFEGFDDDEEDYA